MKRKSKLKYLFIVILGILILLSTSTVIITKSGINIKTIFSELINEVVKKNILLDVKTRYDTEPQNQEIGENTAKLSWKLSDDETVQKYKYTVNRSVGNMTEGNEGTPISNINDKINVLNVYPVHGTSAEKSIFKTSDDDSKRLYYTQNKMVDEQGQFTLDKAASLKEWMERENDGFGKGLIEVTPVSLTEFNTDPEKYLRDDVHALPDDTKPKGNNQYKYDVIFFGSWDCNGANGSDDLTGNHTVSESQTLSSSTDMVTTATNDITATNDMVTTANTNSVTIVENFIKDGGKAIFGHDTIGLIGGKTGNLCHPNFAYLGKNYVNVTCETSYSMKAVTDVYISKDGVFTTYPWDITEGKELIDTQGETEPKRHLTIPAAHDLGQTANGDIWLRFNLNDTSNNNFYLTTYEKPDDSYGNYGMCAMIQTGHSSGAATKDEQKIIANLIFYVNTVDDISSDLTDSEFIDKNKPSILDISEEDIQISENNTETVTVSAIDEGTTYSYFVEGENKTNPEDKIESEIIKKERPATGVVKYEYYIDGKNNTELDSLEGDMKSSITVDAKKESSITLDNIPIGDKKETWLHIRAIDKAENIGSTKHILIYTDKLPTITEIKKEPTIWTNQDVTVTFETSDIDGTVDNIKYSKEGVADNTLEDSNFKVNENGTYIITATDNAQQSATQNIEISNIDKDKPKGSFTTSTDEDGDLTETIKFTATDETSGIKEIKLIADKDFDDYYEFAQTIYSTSVENDGEKTGIKEWPKSDGKVDGSINIPDECKSKIIITDFAENQTEVAIEMESGGVSEIHRDYYHNDNTSVQEFGTTEHTGKVGDSYTTSAKDIERYKLITTPNNQIGRLGRKKKVVIYEYIKISYLTTKYVDFETGTELEKETLTEYQENEELDLRQKMIEKYQPVGYVLGEYAVGDEILSFDTFNKKMETEDQTITIIYKKISEGVVVKYVDKITNEQLDSRTYTGVVGDEIKLEQLKIDGYELVEKPEELDVELTVDPQEITFYYKKVVTMTVVAIDEKTGKEIYNNSELKGLEGEKYTVNTPEIDGYKVNNSKLPENETGIYDRNNTTVTFYYNKIAGGVRVRYVDENGKDLVENEIISGVLDEPYTTEYKEFDKYKLVSVDGNKTGNMTEKEIVVTYHYEKKRGKVKVQYVDDNGNVMYSEEIENYVGEKYQTNKKDFENYDYDRVDGLEKGYIEEETNIVTYHYKAKPKNVLPQTGENNIINIIKILIPLLIIGIIILKIELKKYKNN